MKKLFTIGFVFSLLLVPSAFAQELSASNIEGVESILAESIEEMEASLSGAVEVLSEEPSIESKETSESEEALHSSPQGRLPFSANTKFSVVNISKGNQDATVVGAQPGDVLKYEIRLESMAEDVYEYVASINVASILNGVDFTDTGLGTLRNGIISYPAYSHKAPCEQIFTFFAQVKPECGEMTNLNVSAEGNVTNVNLSCELARTGPQMHWFLMLGTLALFAVFFMGFTRKTKG